MRNTTHKVREATHNKRKVNGGLGCRGGGGAFLTNSNFLLQNKNEFSTYNIRGVDVRAGRQLDQQRLGMPFQRRPLSSRTWDNISIIPPHVRDPVYAIQTAPLLTTHIVCGEGVYVCTRMPPDASWRFFGEWSEAMHRGVR